VLGEGDMKKFTEAVCGLMVGCILGVILWLEFQILRNQLEIWEDLRQSRKIIESWSE
jgi:hypothetical protein